MRSPSRFQMEMLVESISGAYDNVMGLPVAAVLERLRACGAVAG